MSGPSEREGRQGVRRLKALLPAARASVRRGEHGLRDMSPVLEAQAPWVRADNFAALVIYPAPLGGYHADVLLRHTPPGVSNVLGTPVQNPCTSLAQAETVAFELLCCALQIEAAQKAAGKPASGDRAFLLYGFTFDLPGRVYNAALDEFPHMADGLASEALAIERIEAELSKLFAGREVTADALRALPREALAGLLSVCLIATLSGVYRYPPKAPKPATTGPYYRPGDVAA